MAPLPDADPPPARRVDPRVVHTRQVVIDAVADLLSTDGLAQLTMDAIAARSGVARSTIYRHWPDRVELMVDVFESVSSVADPLDPCGPLHADLRATGDSLARGLTEHRWGLILSCLVGTAGHDDAIHRALNTFGRARRAESAEIFSRAITRGEIRSDLDPVCEAERFAGPFFLRRLVTADTLDADFVEAQVRATCRALGAPYEHPPAV